MPCRPRLPPLPDYSTLLDAREHPKIASGAVILLTYAMVQHSPSDVLVRPGKPQEYHKRLTLRIFHSPYLRQMRLEDGAILTDGPQLSLGGGITNWQESTQQFQSLKCDAPLVLTQSKLVACSGERFGDAVYCIPSAKDPAVHRPECFSYDWCSNHDGRYCQTTPIAVHVPEEVSSHETLDRIVLPMLASHIHCVNGDSERLAQYVRSLPLPERFPGVEIREQESASYLQKRQRRDPALVRK